MMNVLRKILPLICIAWAGSLEGHEPVERARSPIQIPEIPGYVTLRCDFHIHTVFSDGVVWPTVRAEEAWRDGLDAIAITDHIEYQPHKADVSTNHNRSHEIALSLGQDLNVMVVKGSEITRKMPPGHLNAIFLTNSMSLAVPEWRDALAEAHKQGAFIFWNHPGWAPQLTEGKTVWHPEHTELLEKGFLQGIEVVNNRSYYPEAHRWAIEKKLTMLSNSDIHQPIPMAYQAHQQDYRPVTLVFAKARTAEALKEALLDRNTAVYAADRLIGEEKFLRPIFEASIRLTVPQFAPKGSKPWLVQIENRSAINFNLERNGSVAGFSVPEKLTLPAGKTVLVAVTPKSASRGGKLSADLPYKVMNLLVGPDKPLEVVVRTGSGGE